jgi:hypothetical protein
VATGSAGVPSGLLFLSMLFINILLFSSRTFYFYNLKYLTMPFSTYSRTVQFKLRAAPFKAPSAANLTQLEGTTAWLEHCKSLPAQLKNRAPKKAHLRLNKSRPARTKFISNVAEPRVIKSTTGFAPNANWSLKGRANPASLRARQDPKPRSRASAVAPCAQRLTGPYRIPFRKNLRSL